MTYSTLEKQRENNQRYYRGYYAKNKEKILKYHNEYTKKRREEARALLGSRCFFCGRIRKLCFHKKDGVSHKGTDAFYLVKKNPKAWVLLCVFPCHNFVHWCMRHLGMFWSEIEMRLPLKGNENDL